MPKARSTKAAVPGKRGAGVRGRTDGSPRLVEPGGHGNPSPKYWAIVWSERRRSRARSTGALDEDGAKVELAHFLNARAAPKGLLTVNDVLDWDLAKLEEEHKALGRRPALIKARRSALRFVRERFGPLAPGDLDPNAFDLYADDRIAGRLGAQRVTKRTPSLELAYLKASLRRAHKKRMIPSVPDIAIPEAKTRARTRVLRDAELVRLRDALRDAPLHLRLFVLVSMYTGQRGVHIRNLRWEHVSLELGEDGWRGWLYFTESNPGAASNKQCSDCTVAPALMPHLLQAYEVWRNRPVRMRSPFVIAYEDNQAPLGSLKTGWASLCARAKLTDLHIHDLRRSFATLMARGGEDLGAIADFMNLDKKTLRRHYAHGAPRALLAKIEGLEE